MAATRLDSLLVERGLFQSRARAARAVTEGSILIGEPSRPAARPSQRVAADAPIAVTGEPQMVSRAGLKLANALEHFGIGVGERRCLDVGASTGGFSDCLLRRGAGHVVALDVTSAELDPRLARDPRMTPVEMNARKATAGDLPYRPDLIVADISFISLRKVLPAVLACAADEFDCLALVKPQFEVGRDLVGKGGVVRDAGHRRAALVGVADHARAAGYAVLGFASSGLPGPAGNRETFVWVGPGSRGGITDVEAAAAEVEP